MLKKITLITQKVYYHHVNCEQVDTYKSNVVCYFGQLRINSIIKLLTGSSKTKIYSDKGFLGISDYLDNNTQSIQPKKRSKNHQLTKRERVKNRQINGIRVKVEHTIGDMRTYARMVDAYDGTLEEFETEFSAVTGLVNLRTMWKKIRSRWKKGEPPPPP